MPLLFTWPSAGALGAEAYTDDQTAAQRAGPALARLLEELAPRLAIRGRRVNLLAHSMGNWALQNGLVGAGPALLSGPLVFDTAVLAAADVARDVLEPGRPMAPLLDLSRRVVVTVYRGDATLTELSEPRNGPRLGAEGPRDAIGAPRNLFAVDCYRIIQYDELARPEVGGGGTDWNDIRHQYYRNQPLVRGQLARALGGAALPLDTWRRGRPDPTITPSARERVAPFYWYAEATPQA
jgi:esterase/lipase superfamily enzyme